MAKTYDAHEGQTDLFSEGAKKAGAAFRPHAPQDAGRFIGQEHIVGPGRLLRRADLGRRTAKLDLFRAAGLRQNHAGEHHRQHHGAAISRLNAVTAGVKEVREVLSDAKIA